MQPSMSEREAQEKYEDYKTKHMREALEEFFTIHKRSYWVREKYLPELADKRQAYIHECTKRRLAVFQQLKSEGHFDDVVLSSELTMHVRRLVELINIRLEDARDMAEYDALIEEELQRQQHADASKQAPPAAAAAADAQSDASDSEPGSRSRRASSATTPAPTGAAAAAAGGDGAGGEALELDYDAAEEPSDATVRAAQAAAAARSRAIHQVMRHSRTLYSRGIPPTVTRADLETSLSSIADFRRVALSSPTEADVQVTAWIVFAPRSGLGDHRTRLAQLQPPLRCSALSGDVHLVHPIPVSPTDIDKTLLASLVHHFDELHGLPGQQLSSFASVYEMILYLRVVHSYDYYMALEFETENELAHRCCMVGVHSHHTVLELSDPDHPQVAPRHIEIARARLAPPPVSVVQYGGVTPEVATEQCVSQHTRCVKAEVYQCTACAKLFKTEDFVHKHVVSKHPDAIAQAVADATMYTRYVQDPRRPLFLRRRHAPPTTAPALLPYPDPSHARTREDEHGRSSYPGGHEGGQRQEYVKDQFGRDRPVALRTSPPPARSSRRQLADYSSLLLPNGAP